MCVRQIDFGPISVATEAECVATLRNVGDCPAVFWMAPAPQGMKVTPDRGRILMGDSIDLVVTLRANQPTVFDEKRCSLVMNLRGAKPISLPFCAQAVLPDVNIVEPECVTPSLPLSRVCGCDLLLLLLSGSTWVASRSAA